MDILSNKQYKSYTYISRYASFPYYYNNEDKKYIYGITSQLNTDVPYVLHKVELGETLDSIALDAYSNSTYFWVIADFNNIQNPYNKLKVGTTLKIPSLNNVKFKEI